MVEIVPLPLSHIEERDIAMGMPRQPSVLSSQHFWMQCHSPSWMPLLLYFGSGTAAATNTYIQIRTNTFRTHSSMYMYFILSTKYL